MAVKLGKKEKHAIPSASRGLLVQLAAMPEHLKRADFRQQYAALCFRRVPDEDDIEILVITSRQTGRWIIPKGWPMKKKKPHEAAALEAPDEAARRVRAVELKSLLVHFRPKRKETSESKSTKS